MAHFEDLSEFRYIGDYGDAVVNVGWLEAGHEYERGSVDAVDVLAMARLVRDGWAPFFCMGYHACSLCPAAEEGGVPYELDGKPLALGAANLFVPSEDRLYVAPSLIIHYIEEHGYAPPQEFLRAVRAVDMATLEKDCERLIDQGAFDRYVEAQRKAADLEPVRKRWIDAVPAGVALQELEGGGGIPRRLDQPTAAAALAAVVEAHASPQDATVALLRWYGSGEGPWSGFRSYEGLAAQLLNEVGTKSVLEAVKQSWADAQVCIGAARYLQHIVRVRRADARLVDRDTTGRLLEHVREQGNADNLTRLRHALAPLRTVVIRSELAFSPVGATDMQVARNLVVDGERCFATDGLDIVGFVPGSIAPIVLHTGTEPFMSLAVDAEHLFVLYINAGTVCRIPKAGGALEVIAADRKRPMYPLVASGQLWWGDQAQEPAPDLGVGHVRQTQAILHMPASGGAPETVLYDPEGGSGLAVTDRYVYRAARSEGRSVLERMTHDGQDRTILSELGQFATPIAGQGFVFWKDSVAKVIGSMSTDTPSDVRQIEVADGPLAVAAHGGSLYCIVREGRDDYRILRFTPDLREREQIIRYEGLRSDQPQLAVDDHGIVWTTGYQIFRAEHA